MPTPREVVQTRILTDIIGSVRPAEGRHSTWKVLVVDDASMRVLSSAVRMYDITEKEISLVENIANQRQPLPDMDAIYFLTPCAISVNRLVDDYKDKKSPQYGDVHLFFTNSLEDALLSQIKRAAPLISRVRTLKEVFMQFLMAESFTFHLDMPTAIETLFSPSLPETVSMKKDIASKVVTFCSTLGEYPFIRYSTSHQTASSIASQVQDQLDALSRACTGFPPNLDRERATLLVFDRSLDPLSPCLHEFTYQAMAFDLLPIEGDATYTHEFTNRAGQIVKKSVLLNENDTLWPELRYRHIAEAINFLVEKFNGFMESNKGAQFSKGQVSDLKGMSDAMRSMPQYTEMLSKYSLHITIAQELMRRFTEGNLEKVGYLEQDMATGFDIDSNPVRNLITAITPLLREARLSVSDKMRLLMIYLITQEGIRKADRTKLMEFADICLEDQAALRNLFYLNVSLEQGSKKSSEKKKEKREKRRRDDVPYDLSRFVPPLKDAVEAFILGQMNPKDFPYVKDPPVGAEAGTSVGGTAPGGHSYRTDRPRWAAKAKGGKEEEVQSVGPRILVFIAGGVTYAECRSMAELAKQYKREIVIGGTHLLTPSGYLDALRKIKVSTVA